MSVQIASNEFDRVSTNPLLARLKNDKIYLAKQFAMDKQLLDYSLYKGQVTKEEYEALLSVMSMRRDGADISIKMKYTDVNLIKTIKWSVSYNGVA